MHTFADKPKVQVSPARSALSGLWRSRQKADWKPVSVQRESLGFDFSFARISVDAPKRAHDQPIDSSSVQTKKIEEEMKVEPSCG